MPAYLLAGGPLHAPSTQDPVTSADPRHALRFLQRAIASVLQSFQPLRSRLLPETLWYTSGWTIGRSNVATQ